MKIHENILNTLTEEQKQKVEAAKSPEDLLALAKEYGQELSPDQIAAVAGGEEIQSCWMNCPRAVC